MPAAAPRHQPICAPPEVSRSTHWHRGVDGSLENGAAIVRHRTPGTSGVAPVVLPTVDRMNPTPTLPPALRAWSADLAFARADRLPQITNPVWLAVTDDERRFVLKELPEYPPGVGPIDEFRVLCHLASVGIPIALPIITDDGRLMATIGERRYSLLPWIAHDDGNHELRPDATVTSRSIGAAIGRLDAALTGCPWQPPSFVDDPAREVLDNTLPKLPELASMVAPLKDQLWTAVHDLPTQLTNGDCNTGNVLISGPDVVGFLDLDHLPNGPRVRDLSYYLGSRLRQHLAHDPTAERDSRAWIAALEHYVTGYHTALPLTARELAAIVPLILVIEIGSTAWCVNGWVPDPAGYRHGLNVIAWLIDRLDELTDAATIDSR